MPAAKSIGSSKLELVLGDITKETTDAIANAANSSLAGGGGVDGAIHRAGGPTIMEELRGRYHGCPTGQAVISGAGKLKAKYVIHAVGPRYAGRQQDAGLLTAAYQNSLELAVKHKAKTIAFPSISTGVYGYPLEEAALIALQTVRDYFLKHPEIELVRFVIFDELTYAAYQKALEKI
ncbi:MAG: O-acetyl-ADP-ribose deacetylase [Elusimicrobia bacterium]|nr:O-acetyl-ADP-ribose deacetylase [Elusimicrobiota bacterium]